jgi:hypothetical protein
LEPFVSKYRWVVATFVNNSASIKGDHSATKSLAYFVFKLGKLFRHYSDSGLH